MLAAFLAVFLALPARAQNDPLWPSGWKPETVTQWGGLDLLSDSSVLGGDAQQAINVLTDNTFLEKRPGNVRLATILPGYQVQYVNDWSAPNGSRYLVAQASQTVYETNFSGSPVALSTIAVGYNLTTVPAFSRLEFADGFRPLWYWDDESTGTVTDPDTGDTGPICTYIAYQDSRIWCANLPDGFSESGNTENGGGSSTVLISSKSGDGYWAVPYDVGQVDDSPNRFDFNPDDGDEITCLASTPWGMFVGKRNSSYIVQGNGNLSYSPLLLDPKTGCVDNRSVQMVYGILMWLAVDGVYGYNGSGPPHLLSRELDPLMQNVRESSFSQGQWATQLQSDWESGTTSSGTDNVPANSWDAVSLGGTVFPSSGTLYDDNTDPALQDCTTNLNPDNGLPYTCGVGFSSDTLVNIDTVTAPLSVGYAQIFPSTSGVSVWSGNYDTASTTWTQVGTPAMDVPSAGCISIEPFQNAVSGVTSAGAYTTANSSGSLSSPNSSGSLPSPNGWNFGAWSFSFVPVYRTGALDCGTGTTTYGQCDVSGSGNECADFDFMADAPYNTSWNGYGIQVNQGSCSGGNCTFNAQLFKEHLGVRTLLGEQGSFTMPTSASTVEYSTFTVARNQNGYMFLSANGLIISAAADTSFTHQSSVTSVLFNSFWNTATRCIGNGQEISGEGDSGSCFASLKGYGSGSIISHIFDTGSNAPLAGVLSSSYTLSGVGQQTAIDFFVRDSTSPNNDEWSSWQASSNNVLATLPNRYWQYEANFYSQVSSFTPTLGSVELDAVTTGYYYSKVNYVGNLITSWRQFGVTEDNPGTYNYAVREATYNFSPSDNTIPWVSQSANQNVNLDVSTPTYAQFMLDSNPLTSNPEGASAAEPVAAVFLRWNQGANLPVTSDTLERRYILCFTISPSAAAPDTCLIRQKNGKWVEWSNGGTIGAMGIYNNQMVAADGGTSSYVWEIMQPNVYNDDGNPIAASWISADFTDGLPFNLKTYYGTMIDAQAVQGSSVTFSYSVNKSTGYVSTTFSTDNGQGLDQSLPVQGEQYGSVDQWLPPGTLGYDQGKYIRLMFSDDTPGVYFRINSAQFFVHDNPWNPSQ